MYLLVFDGKVFVANHTQIYTFFRINKQNDETLLREFIKLSFPGKVFVIFANMYNLFSLLVYMICMLTLLSVCINNVSIFANDVPL